MKMQTPSPRRASKLLRSRTVHITLAASIVGAVALGVTIGAADPGAEPATANATSATAAASSSSTALSSTSTVRATTTTHETTTTTGHRPSALTSPPTHAARMNGPSNPSASSPPPTAPAPPVVMQPGGVQVFCGGWITRRPPTGGIVVDDSTGGRMPTAADCANAHAFYNAVRAANAKYANIAVAIAAGFKRGGDPASQVPQHYVQWGPSPGILDPNHPEGLVYRIDSSGNATLLAVMFVESGGNLPQPGGPLTVWHHHTTGNAGHMLHVWLFPGAIDPFALMYSNAL